MFLTRREFYDHFILFLFLSRNSQICSFLFVILKPGLGQLWTIKIRALSYFIVGTEGGMGRVRGKRRFAFCFAFFSFIIERRKASGYEITFCMSCYFNVFKVWTHYDVDRSGYIESDELEVWINTNQNTELSSCRILYIANWSAPCQLGFLTMLFSFKIFVPSVSVACL